MVHLTSVSPDVLFKPAIQAVIFSLRTAPFFLNY